ncbi:hypothetical protein Dimus_001633 [Dionaea muscipula]
MIGVLENGSDLSEYVEVDPTGRYGRYNEVLGKGSSKTVYRAFDEYEGIEVAWNKVKLTDFLQRPEDLERLYNEVHLLKTLKHRNIMKFYASWVDTANRSINFVTEMFTSGTLRQYRLKHKSVNIRAIKHWCRQILYGLLYLHSLEPPVIHRDLKCDNIFVNGNQGEVKIGDLGLAAILRKTYAAHCVGTPEFMAPEVFAEEYNELVDIYSFGMCVLEMVTLEYPYSECTNPAQIYKKVMSGKKPHSLYKVKNLEVRAFIEKCLATVSCRLSATELLRDPFLLIDDHDPVVTCHSDLHEIFPFAQVPLYDANHSPSSLPNDCSDHLGHGLDHDTEYVMLEFGRRDVDLFTSGSADDDLTNVDIAIKGKRQANNDIFLRLRMADKEGRVRNIYFPFDIETDTASSVAAEMVSELDITDQDVTRIVEMIDREIASLVPNWKGGEGGQRATEVSESSNLDCKERCDSNKHLKDYAPLDNLQVLHCTSRQGDVSGHGRFEEITYQVEACPATSTSLHSRMSSRFSVDHESINQMDEEMDDLDDDDDQSLRAPNNSPASSITGDQENEIRKEMRWLKNKYKRQLKELKDQVEIKLKLSMLIPNRDSEWSKKDKQAMVSPRRIILEKNKYRSADQHYQSYPTSVGCSSQEQAEMGKSFLPEGLIPHCFHRANTLSLDVIDF